jgi:hypothetical protein
MVVRSQRHSWLRRAKILIVGLVVALVPTITPAIASADTFYLDVLWLRCQHQSEPFSDEILIYVNGELHGGWNDVDTGETHWYYSRFPPALLGIPFSGNAHIEVYEADGRDLGLQGWVDADESQANTGEWEGLASQGADDGEYVIRWQVHT